MKYSDSDVIHLAPTKTIGRALIWSKQPNTKCYSCKGINPTCQIFIEAGYYPGDWLKLNIYESTFSAFCFRCSERFEGTIFIDLGFIIKNREWVEMVLETRESLES